MIIDLILDRADGTPYNAHDFYAAVSGYADVFPEIVEPITRALDYGTENDVKQELCEYVQRLNYNPKICDYIRSVDWLMDDEPLNKESARKRFVPMKRTAIDGRVWWCVYDIEERKFSTLLCFGKYRTKKACQYDIDTKRAEIERA